MATNLEKQFFDTFEIPKTCQRGRVSCKQYNRGCDKCCYFDYPQITSDILLELICILSEWRTYLHSDYTVKADNVSSLKEDVLKDFLELFKWYEFKKCENDIKQQVRALFKEQQDD